MKRILYIILLVLGTQTVSLAQNEQQMEKVREKMTEYIQDRLSLTKAEAEKFSPIFIDYFKELRRTNQEFRGGDRLVLQQKIVELRLRYREQFKPVIGEKRSNEVFIHERDFINKAKEVRQDRLDNHPEGRANKRNQLPDLR
jgi:hypothetical protein